MFKELLSLKNIHSKSNYFYHISYISTCSYQSEQFSQMSSVIHRPTESKRHNKRNTHKSNSFSLLEDAISYFVPFLFFLFAWKSKNEKYPS